MYQPKLVSEVEGNPCHATCDVQWQAFLTAVRQAMPLMSFAHKHDTGAWVYRSDRPYCCGWIEYTGDRYTVQSRHLSNNRYLGGDEYYYTKSSKRLDIAVRNAKKYITPYNIDELAHVKSYEARQHFRNRYRGLAADVQAAYDRTLNVKHYTYFNSSRTEPQLFRELRHLLSSGHKFIHKELEEGLKTYFGAVDGENISNATCDELYSLYINLILVPINSMEYSLPHAGYELRTELQNLLRTGHKFLSATFKESLEEYFTLAYAYYKARRTTTTVTFVYLTEQLACCHDVEFNTSPKAAVLDSAPCLIEDLPEDIQEKIALLGMLPDDDYVEGVGYHVGHNMYYIYRGEC